jgi:hypothetical protein
LSDVQEKGRKLGSLGKVMAMLREDVVEYSQMPANQQWQTMTSRSRQLINKEARGEAQLV